MPSEPSLEKLEQRAKNVLLFQLSRSMKTRFQLEKILEKREIPGDIALRVLDRFVEAQLIDDAVFASAFVASRLATGGKSRAAIARELALKGVASEVIQESLAHLDQELEGSIIRDLAQKRAAQLARFEPEIRRRRLVGYLQRRGFNPGLVATVVREIERAR